MNGLAVALLAASLASAPAHLWKAHATTQTGGQTMTLVPFSPSEVRQRILGHVFGKAPATGELVATDTGPLVFYEDGVAVRYGGIGGAHVSHFDITANQILFRSERGARNGYAFYWDLNREIYVALLINGGEMPPIKAYLTKALPRANGIIRKEQEGDGAGVGDP